MGLFMSNLDFHTVLWLSSKSKRLQREVGRSYIIMYDLSSEVNITLFSPRFKRREHRPYFVLEGISKSHCENSLWDGRYCHGHTISHTWLALIEGESGIKLHCQALCGQIRCGSQQYHPVSGFQPFYNYPFFSSSFSVFPRSRCTLDIKKMPTQYVLPSSFFLIFLMFLFHNLPLPHIDHRLQGN